MKDAYYFSHDGNARNDEKILALRSEYGWEGYGIFWMLVEMMFENKDTCLQHKSIKSISTGYNIDITLLSSVINTAITENLFVSDGNVFWSETLRRRKQMMLDIREAKSKAGKIGMKSRWGGRAENTTSNNTVITQLLQPDNTVITSKVNKVKEIKNIYGEFSKVKLTSEEYTKLIDKFGEVGAIDKINRLDEYIASKGKRYSDHYATILSWARKNESTQATEKPRYETKRT